jgi:hypothetical protein
LTGAEAFGIAAVSIDAGHGAALHCNESGAGM